MTRAATALACALVEIGGGGAAPATVVLVPAGEFRHRGEAEPLRNSDPEAVVRRTRARMAGQRMVVDYEHQTLHAEANGRPAPAAGWIADVRVDASGAVVADVEWTEAAKRAIEAREYRYLSPVFLHDKGTRAVKTLLNAGLTNTPALPAMPALAARHNLLIEEDRMEEKELRKLLGLADDADAEAAEAALEKLREEAGAKALGAVAARLGLAGDATEDQIVAAAKPKPEPEKDDPPDPAKVDPPDPAAWVPRPEYDRLAARVNTLETARTADFAANAVGEAVAAGKVAPAQREWALAYAAQDLEGFRKFADAAPTLLQSGAQATAAPPSGGLTAEEVAVCRDMGIDEDAFKKAKEAGNGGA